MGAYTTSRAADIAQQNAANARAANLQSGLFGLGSSAILGAGGVGNLLGSIGSSGSAGSGLLGLGSAAASGLGSIGSGINNWYNNLNFGTSGMTPGMINAGVTGNVYDDFGTLISSGNAAPAAADWASSFASGW
jgi:hypothetical protein